MIVLADALRENPHAPLAEVIRFFGLEEKIQSLAKSATLTLDKVNHDGDHSSRMSVSHAHLGNPLSVVTGSARFLFDPFPFIDNGSFFLNLLSYESFLWWFLYVMVGVTTWKRIRKRELDDLAVFLLVFILGFVVFSAITEVNVGTLVRHRSVLLFPMLYFILAPKRTGNLELTT